MKKLLYSECIFLMFSIRTAQHLFVRGLPSSSMRIHCIPSVAWLIRVAGGVLAVSRFCRSISLTICGMSSPIPLLASLPLGGRVFPLCISLRFSVRGGVVLTSPRNTTPGSEGCFQKFWSFLPVISVGKMIQWQPPPPLSIWLCPFL